MFVYLDESGDTGFRFRQGSSRFFVITLMLVHDPLPIHQAIDDLRAGLGMDRNSEFKWYRSSEETRWAFLRMLRKQDFTARAMVIDKSMMARTQASPAEAFYNVLV